MLGCNPSHFLGASRPVEQITWDDAMLFCERLNLLEFRFGTLSSGLRYLLPSEAQWECACIKGQPDRSTYTMSDVAWSRENSESQTHPVGMLLPNLFGIHDMFGNVREICLDICTESLNHQGSGV